MVTLGQITFLGKTYRREKGRQDKVGIHPTRVANQVADSFKAGDKSRDSNAEVIKPYGDDNQYPFIIRGTTIQEIEHSLKPYIERLERNEYEFFLRLRSHCDYPTHLKTIAGVVNNLEKISPGAHTHIKNWLVGLKNPNDIKKLPLFERYIERLAIHGETELDDALAAITSLKIVPTENLIDNMLTLHRRGGFLRVNRLVDPKKGNRLQTLERTVAKLVKNFDDKDYEVDKKVALLCVTGVIQFETTETDMFAQGGDVLIETLENGDQKILVFEIDNDKQLALAEKRAHEATGKNIDLYMFLGHGTSQTTNLGYTTKPKLFRKLNQEYVEEIKNKERHADYLKLIQEEAEAGKSIWKIHNLSSGSLTRDDTHLDTSDADIMGSFTRYKNDDATAVFASCSVASGENSLAETFHDATGMTVFGCIKPIKGLKPVFHNGKVIEVMYKTQSGEILRARKFPEN